MASRRAPLAPLERRRATTAAVEALQEEIRTGRYGPGERLPSERELSDSLGVSRPTVREALQALAVLNIVEMRHGSGTYVSSLEFGELLRPLDFALEVGTPALQHLFELRLAIEPLAAALAADRATDEDLARISDLVEQSSAPDLGRKKLVELDVQLHALIVEATGNPLLIALHRSLAGLALQSREITSRSPASAHRAAADHRRLLKQLERRDSASAAAAMHRHLTRIWAESRTT